MIGLIVPANLKFSPYVRYYTRLLEEAGVPYETVVWDRRGLTEEADHVFAFPVADSDRRRVMLGYVKFAAFAAKTVRRRGCSGLIVFTAAAGFFLAPMLCTAWRNRFLLDIRDDSPIVRKLPGVFRKVCAAARDVCVSSPAYAGFTGRDAHMCHNADLSVIAAHLDDEVPLWQGESKSIVFAGMLIEGKINLELTQLLAGSDRYSLGFVGTDCPSRQVVETFARERGMTNIFFRGPYEKAEITAIYRETAAYVNIIRAQSRVNAQALPNKLYDAVIAGRPVLVLRHNSAVAQLVEEYRLGAVLDALTLAELDAKTAKFEAEVLATGDYALGRRRFLEQVLRDGSDFSNTLHDFMKQCGEKHD